MSPETIVGQILPTRTMALVDERAAKLPDAKKADAWEGIFCLLELDMVRENSQEIIEIQFESDNSIVPMTAAEAREFIYGPDTNLCVTANGTIFRTDIQGIIPTILTEWYTSRQKVQASAASYRELMDKGLELPVDFANEMCRAIEVANCDAKGATSDGSKTVIEADEILNAVNSRNFSDVEEFRKRFGLELQISNSEARLIVGENSNKTLIKELIDYFDRQSQIIKITLNSFYGALLNKALLFYDARLGQSTTLTGRSVVRHMGSRINEVMTGTYNHIGGVVVAGDTDSVAGDSIINTSLGEMTIEKLFQYCSKKWSDNGKEYAVDGNICVFDYDPKEEKASLKNINYVYRHRVTKRRFKITDSNGNSVIVTEDHSIMIERNDSLIEVKPQDIRIGDITIAIKKVVDSKMVQFLTEKATVFSVEELSPFNDEYVYDIGMKSNNPYFFANNILVHNSVYFTSEISGSTGFSKEQHIDLYKSVVDEVNVSFSDFMDRAFNTGPVRGDIIKASLELIMDTALFIKKKKYAGTVYWKEGIRLDKDGPGKLKITGLDLKRSDTPLYMQKFLEGILKDVLSGISEGEIMEKIQKFRIDFKMRPGWEKGSPMKVNNLSAYSDKIEAKTRDAGKFKARGKEDGGGIPRQIMASLAWNRMAEINGDKRAPVITDGARIIVCSLKSNIHGMKSIAYPVDIPRLPQWCMELPFNDDLMEDVIIDSKTENLLGVMNWDLSKSRLQTDSFFEF
jgi:hypothetical protein